MPSGVYKRVKTHPAWNKGLRKETDERMMLISKKVSKTKKGVKLTEEHKRKIGESQLGSKSHFWKGGKTKNHAGYILVKCRGHHRANKTGYVREHILVAEKMIGRKLEIGEVVHHLNGKKDDNREKNLMVLLDKNHRSLHLKERRKKVCV